MIFGAHVLFYSQDSDADRAFFSNVLELRSVDVGHGWLIFAMPPAEAAIHPAEGEFSQTHAGHELMIAGVAEPPKLALNFTPFQFHGLWLEVTITPPAAP